MGRGPVDRRGFLKSASIVSGGVLIFGACKTRSDVSDASGLNSDEAGKEITRVRYSVYSAEGKKSLAVYDQIVGYLKTTQHQGKSYWECLADIHLNHCPHANWFFLPWHRAYTYYFEEICREVAKSKVERTAGLDAGFYDNWTLPYWDWNSTRAVPEEFFDKQHLKEPRAIERGAKPAAEIFSTENLTKLASNADFYLYCSGPAKEQRGQGDSGALEASPHNAIHVWLGGEDKMMATFMSPMDPIFWAHHCNIDRLWLEWTKKCMDGGLKFIETLPPKKEGEELDVDFWRNHELTEFWVKTPANTFKLKVGDTLDCKGGPLRFTYDTLRGKEPVPTKLPGGGYMFAGSSDYGPLANRVPVMTTATIDDIKEGFIINEEKGTILMKFKMDPAKMSAEDRKLVLDVANGIKSGEELTNSAVLLLEGIQVADDKVARRMLLKFRASYDGTIKNVDLGTTGFFVHSHAGHDHGPTRVDLQINIAPLMKILTSTSDLEKKVITFTASAVQVADPSKPVRLDKKMFEGTQSTKVEASLELRRLIRK